MDIVAMEVTKEEMEKIVRDRVESARKAEIDECAEIIRRALNRIDELGGSVYNTGANRYKACAHCLNSVTPMRLDVRYHKF